MAALNPERLAALVRASAGHYSSAGQVSSAQMRARWVELCACPDLVSSGTDTAAPDMSVSFMTPRPVSGVWGDSLVPVSVAQAAHPYRVGSVDGSQVYPDHHEGVPFFLVHTATVLFTYGLVGSESAFVSTSDLSVHSVHDFDLAHQQLSSVALVDRMRTESELRAGLELVKTIGDRGVVLFDGSLIFWNLTTRSAKTDPFFRAYCAILLACAERRAATAWYTSLPQGRDLTNLVRALFSDTRGDDSYKSVIDTDLLTGWLAPGYRTGLFFSGADIADYYPEPLRPVFFYMHTGDEIARIEVPAWMAHEPGLVTYVAGVILDQCHKGQGYPISLAEAHEHAVVRSADRELFFSTARSALQAAGQGSEYSRKSLNKLRAGF